VDSSAPRWETERELAESKERYRSLFAYSPHAAFSLDIDGTFVDANAVAQELSGYTLAEFTAVDFTHLLVPEDVGRAAAAFEGALHRQPQKLQATMLTKDGRRKELNLAAVPVIVDDEVVGVHGTAEDMTKENALVRDLERARRAAEDANAAKSLFLANMSHEVRTPLTSVLGAGEMLAEGDLDPGQRYLVDVVRRSGDRLLRLVNDILDVSRLEVGHLEMDVAAFDVRALVDDALCWGLPFAAREHLELSSVIADEVPSVLLGDSFRITQVLTNLIGNALKFTDRGLVRVRVDLEGVDGDTHRLRLAVEDSGIGIPDEQLPLLFESFAQADTSTTRRHGGAGLGLAICRELVALMSGTIEVSSVPGEGSTFTVVLPLTSPSSELLR
jgi:PAS domain S-box-containing protein